MDEGGNLIVHTVFALTGIWQSVRRTFFSDNLRKMNYTEKESAKAENVR